jgi:hypothetical protein
MFKRISERFAAPASSPPGSRSVDVRCVVASESRVKESVAKEEWRSLSEVIGKVLTSVGREDRVPAAASGSRARKLN